MLVLYMMGCNSKRLEHSSVFVDSANSMSTGAALPQCALLATGRFCCRVEAVTAVQPAAVLLHHSRLCRQITLGQVKKCCPHSRKCRPHSNPLSRPEPSHQYPYCFTQGISTLEFGSHLQCLRSSVTLPGFLLTNWSTSCCSVTPCVLPGPPLLSPPPGAPAASADMADR